MTPYKSYNITQGDGYFVRRKNKLEDEFSTDPFDAFKYKSIRSALTRLGLNFNDSIKSIDDFFKANNLNKSFQRGKSISELLGEKSDSVISDLFFERGHIDKIDENGNFCGNAGNEVMKYIEDFIRNNIRKHNLVQKNFESLGIGNYINKSVSDFESYEDFWNEIFKK